MAAYGFSTRDRLELTRLLAPSGALVPLLPYLLGWLVLAASLGITAVALIAGGMTVGRLTGRPVLRSACASFSSVPSPSRSPSVSAASSVTRPANRRAAC